MSYIFAWNQGNLQKVDSYKNYVEKDPNKLPCAPKDPEREVSKTKYYPRQNKNDKWKAGKSF